MASSPLFSIVIPSYNQASFLEECIRSALEQSYPRREVIVIDGGSTDGSLEILQMYKSRLAYWISEPDRGQAHAVNKGWARAKGDVLGWLNSDDRLEGGALQLAAEAFAGNPQASLIYGDVREVDPQGRPVALKPMAGFGLHSLLLGKNMGQPGVFVSRRTYEALGGLEESLHYALDFEYFLRAWTAFPESGVYLREVLASSRVWELAKTIRKGGEFGAEYRNVLEKYFAQTDLPPEIRALRRRALGRSVYFRQARLFLQGGNWAGALIPLARAIWLEGSPVEAAKLIRISILTWMGRRVYES
jgi:glycosyltransferase involved in cell wall biosynthesis